MSIGNICRKIFSHPFGRGMITSGLTFPTGCFIQQYYNTKKIEDVSWRKCLRYSLYGAFISSPMFFVWLKLGSKIWKKQSLSTALQKAVIEQVTFAPIAMSSFFFTIAFVENDFNSNIAVRELKRKFWDSYKVAVCYWPIVQTINFTFIPDRNRLVFISFSGLLWVIFLTYVDLHESPFNSKSKEIDDKISVE